MFDVAVVVERGHRAKLHDAKRLLIETLAALQE
jgi:hypothetical protein